MTYPEAFCVQDSSVRNFADLLDVLLPERGTIVLIAYFDASARQRGTFCVAGLVFAKDQVKKFDKEWLALFGKYGGCHMKDLTHGTGAFKGMAPDETGELLKQAIRIIDRRVSFGVSVACDVNEMNALLPKWMSGFEHAYPVCCHLSMLYLGNRISEILSGERIAYFFEAGDSYSASAHAFMQKLSQLPALKDECLYHSHSFIGKNDALALQAADIWAWEWAKYWDETAFTKERKMRKSLVALLNKNGEFDKRRYSPTYLTGGPLRQWAEKVIALGLEPDGKLASGRASSRDAQ